MRYELKTVTLFVVIYLRATLLGAIVYERIAVYPVYLSALPGSSVIVNAKYDLHQARFWQMIHSLLIVALILATVLNRQSKARRKLLGATVIIYALVLVSTFGYFLPALTQFQNSPNLPAVSPAEWFARGQRWQMLSIIRGAVMFFGFLPLLLALTKPTGVSSVI